MLAYVTPHYTTFPKTKYSAADICVKNNLINNNKYKKQTTRLDNSGEIQLN